jgi:hypothetical protein
MGWKQSLRLLLAWKFYCAHFDYSSSIRLTTGINMFFSYFLLLGYEVLNLLGNYKLQVCLDSREC